MEIKENHLIKYSLDNIKEGDSIYQCYFDYNKSKTIENLHVMFSDENPDEYIVIKGIVRAKPYIDNYTKKQYNKYILIVFFNATHLSFIPIMDYSSPNNNGLYTVMSDQIDDIIYNPRPKPQYPWDSSSKERPFPSEIIVIGKENAYRLALKHKRKESKKAKEMVKEMESYLENKKTNHFVNPEFD